MYLVFSLDGNLENSNLLKTLIEVEGSFVSVGHFAFSVPLGLEDYKVLHKF